MLKLLAILLCVPTLAIADPILRTTAFASSYSDFEDIPTCYVEGTTSANCNRVVAYTPPGVGEGTAYSGQVVEASAASGHVQGVAYEYPVDADFSSIFGYYLVATAEVTEMMTITSGTGTGSLQYLFSGSIYSASSNWLDPDYNSSFKFRHDGGDLIEAVNGAPGWESNYGGPSSGDLDLQWENQYPYLFSYVSAPMPFTYGVPFEMYIYGRAMTEILGDGGGNGSLDVTFDGFRVAPTAIPEPTSMILFGSGITAALWRRRRAA